MPKDSSSGWARTANKVCFIMGQLYSNGTGFTLFNMARKNGMINIQEKIPSRPGRLHLEEKA
jgi:hypothetical protein